MTPSVPVQPNGAIPGPGSPVDEAQFIYVAASGVFPFFPAGGDDTIAYKLHVNDGVIESQYEFLPIPDTDPAPALSVSQLATPDREDAEVLISTSTNLFLATTRDMDLTGEIDFDSDLVAGVDGFRQTTAATSGPLYYLTDDSGAADRRPAQRRQDAADRRLPAGPGQRRRAQRRRRPAVGLARLRAVRRPRGRVRLPQHRRRRARRSS